MIMNEIVSKIKNFFMGNYKTMVIVGGIIIVCFLIWYVFSGRENVFSNGVSTNDIRTELSNAQDAKSDIAETVGNLANSINNVTDTSERFDQLINECQSIIDQIREQPAGE